MNSKNNNRNLRRHPHRGLAKALALFSALLTIHQATMAQSNFSVTPNLAFQASFPAKESYQYRIAASTNLTTWFPVTGFQASAGGTETMTFGMTNGPHVFYRAEEFPPDLTTRIVGLTNVFFDNAAFTAQGSAMSLSGFRVQSRDYNLNDYLSAAFQFDRTKQVFSLTNLQVFTNVGVICGQPPTYFIRNATNALVLTNGATTLTPDLAHSITSTGQVLTVSLGVGQPFAFDLLSLGTTTHVSLSDPNGKLLLDDVWSSGFSWYGGSYGGLVPGVYSLRLTPQGTSSESVTLKFHNDNGHVLRVLTNGMNFSTTIGDYSGDYDKFQVALAANQTLQLTQPGTDAVLGIYNSRGVLVYDRAGLGTLFFTPTVADTYYVIYFHNDIGGTHNYSSTVSITP